MSKKFKILVSDKLGQVGLDQLEAAPDAEYDLKTGLSLAELIEIIPNYDALLVRSGTKVTADILQAGVNLKVVGRAGIGVDNIDIRAATERGIIVMNTPQANAIATAEHTIGLMLAACRHIAPAHASLAAGEWKRSHYAGIQLFKKTLGVIGFGRIGRLVTLRAQAFGMEVAAYDPYVSEEVAQELGVTLLDLDDLLAAADIITLHMSSTPETENMINGDLINQMKEGMILVNVARGKLVDEAALAAGLESGKIRLAALDVYQTEPPDAGNPLIGHPKVVHTPHLGATTEEAQRAVAIQIVDQTLDALRMVDYRNAINMPYAAGPGFDESRPYMILAEKLGILQSALAPKPIQAVEVGVQSDEMEKLIRPVAAAALKGVLSSVVQDEIVNYINAPVLAEARGIAIKQSNGQSETAGYTNLIFCKANWDGGERTLAGMLFAGNEPRLVQMDGYHLEANPNGIVLILKNEDVPGVIGQVGTILATYEVNIGEWRMGRHQPSGEALSFINLDSIPPDEALDALRRAPAITMAKLLNL